MQIKTNMYIDNVRREENNQMGRDIREGEGEKKE